MQLISFCLACFVLTFTYCKSNTDENIEAEYLVEIDSFIFAGLSFNEANKPFIAITQGNFTRVLGFYPQGGVQPGINPNSAGVFLNDSNHPYDVSITQNINASQMGQLLNFITSTNQNYNLNSFNCTDFALGASSQCNLNLADAQGSWPFGGGSNPGDLGQDLRGMNSRKVNGNGGNAKSNSGSCPQSFILLAFQSGDTGSKQPDGKVSVRHR